MAGETETNIPSDTEEAHADPEFEAMIERVYNQEQARGGFEDSTAGTRSAPPSYRDESGTFFIGREFTLKEFARWFKAQRLGSRPFNAVGYHHTWKPVPETWAGVPSLQGIFNFFRDERGWPEGLGPQIWVYSGEGRYKNGSPRIYVGTHPAHNGAGILNRNGRWLHIEHIYNGDKASFSEAMKKVSGAVLAIVCSPHPHADRTIPYTFVRKGVNNPDTPLGIMYHRDENPNWAPGEPPKSCPGLKVSHDNLDDDLIRYANEWANGDGGDDGEPVDERGVFTVGATANVRGGPSRAQPELRSLAAGTIVDTSGYTDGGEEVNGSARWYRLKDEDAWIHDSGGAYERRGEWVHDSGGTYERR